MEGLLKVTECTRFGEYADVNLAVVHEAVGSGGRFGKRVLSREDNCATSRGWAVEKNRMR